MGNYGMIKIIGYVEGAMKSIGICPRSVVTK